MNHYATFLLLLMSMQLCVVNGATRPPYPETMPPEPISLPSDSDGEYISQLTKPRPIVHKLAPDVIEKVLQLMKDNSINMDDLQITLYNGNVFSGDPDIKRAIVWACPWHKGFPTDNIIVMHFANGIANDKHELESRRKQVAGIKITLDPAISFRRARLGVSQYANDDGYNREIDIRDIKGELFIYNYARQKGSRFDPTDQSRGHRLTWRIYKKIEGSPDLLVYIDAMTGKMLLYDNGVRS